MKIEQTTFGTMGEAWRLTHEDVEMIVVTGIGPRIMSFRHVEGENILFVDEQGLGYKDWNIYGGSRLWISPESEACYHPDNLPCETIVNDDQFIVYAAPEPSGMQKGIEVTPNPEGEGFEINYVLRNVGQLLWAGASWALTCVKPEGHILAPWGQGPEDWCEQMVRFWRDWGGCHHSDIADPQWQLRQETFEVAPSGNEGKVGLYTDDGWLALLRDDATFVKRARPIPEGRYPDGDCNLAIYTCPHFLEMETMSPEYSYRPGGEYIHTETWLLRPGKLAPEDWKNIYEWLEPRE